MSRNKKAKAITLLVAGIVGLVFGIAVLAQLIGRADMMVPWQEYDTGDVIALYQNGIKIMAGMLGLGFVSGIGITAGISELRQSLPKYPIR